MSCNEREIKRENLRDKKEQGTGDAAIRVSIGSGVPK
jgi:hypothetical protein